MRGRADHLDAVLPGLLVRPRAAEAGQERVVDVDDPAGQLLAHLRGQDPHVPGQHQEIDPVRADQVEQRGLGLGPGARVGAHRHMLERHAVPGGQPGQVRVVADDQRHVDGQRLGFPAVQQVVEAVPFLRHHDQHARPDAQVMQVPVHAELVRDGQEPGAQRGAIRPGSVQHRAAQHLHLDPHEEVVGDHLGELLAVQDVAARAVQVGGHRVHDARPVRAGQGEHELPAAAFRLVSHRRHELRRPRARSRQWWPGTSRTAGPRTPGRPGPGRRGPSRAVPGRPTCPRSR